MNFFIETLAAGLTLGAIYAVAAMAISLVYGATGGFSFAHGGIYLLGALVSALIASSFAPLGPVFAPLALLMSLLAAIAVGVAAGWVLNHNFTLQSRRSGVLPLIASAGLLMSAIGLLQLIQQLDVPLHIPAVQPVVLFVPGVLFVRIAALQPVIITLGVAIMGVVAYVMRRTHFGLLQRAVVQDAPMAELLGVDTARVASFCVLLSSVLAAVAGWMLTVAEGPLTPESGLLAAIYMSFGALMGGLSSLKRSAAGGLVVGIGQVFWSGYFGQSYAVLAVFCGIFFVVRFLPEATAQRSVVKEL